MSWSTLPPELRAIAEEVCTRKQLDALKLWDAGSGYRRISLTLGISTSTARDRIQQATSKIVRRADELGLDVRP